MTNKKNEWLIGNAKQDPASITKNWVPNAKKQIAGVSLIEIKPVMTDYGHLTEVLRSEWLTDAPGVDQVFVSTIHPGHVSAWHAHGRTTDRLFAVTGQFRVVLFDSRDDSPTHGLLSEYKIGAQRPMLIVIPPKVWHGVQNYGSDIAVLLNAVDYAYKYDDPDHWRVPIDTSEIPYTFTK